MGAQLSLNHHGGENNDEVGKEEPELSVLRHPMGEPDAERRSEKGSYRHTGEGRQVQISDRGRGSPVASSPPSM